MSGQHVCDAWRTRSGRKRSRRTTVRCPIRDSDTPGSRQRTGSDGEKETFCNTLEILKNAHTTFTQS